MSIGNHTSNCKSNPLPSPNSDGNKSFELDQVYKDATHYIASLCVLVNDQNEPSIFVGSNDGNVYCYSASSPELRTKLTGHESTVCSVNGHSASQKLITGSWDQTARIWSGGVESAKLVGHDAAVWATCLVDESTALTGSADKTIKIWNIDTCEITKSFEAHSDCVRDLKLVGKTQFLSCSNDATVKRWALDGSLLETYDGHSNYIYSISLIVNDESKLKFATCSEDKTLRIWQAGSSTQSIRVPAQTLWSVCTLANGDLLVGCSNGNIYVYTQDERLHAPPAIQKEIEEEVSKTSLQLSELGDIKVDKLPNKDALYIPGKKEGETKLVKDGESVLAYQWNSAKFEWVKIGDVVGAANASKDPSQKQEYEGRLYDFVFSVDIQDGVPPLKLPYNLDQNPYMVAQDFIDRHELTQAYLEEIASFIIKNSQGGAPAPQQAAPQAADPFTGGSSYRPVNGAAAAGSNSSGNSQQSLADYYPLKTYFLFENINLDGIAKKLKEFSKVVPVEVQVSSDDLKALLTLTDLSKPITDEQIESIRKLLKWPQSNLFPVLDFVRMAVLIPKICEHLCTDSFAASFLDTLLNSATNATSTPNQYLSLRCLSNLFKHTSGQEFIKAYDQAILAKVNNCLQSGNKNVQVALATLYMNFSVFLGKRPNEEIGLATDLALNSIQMLQHQFDPEAQFRALVTLGTLVENDKHMIDLIRSEELFKFLQKLSGSTDTDKLSKCARQLHSKIKG